MDSNDLVLLALVGDDDKIKATLKELLQAKLDAEKAQLIAREEQEKANDILRQAQSERSAAEEVKGHFAGAASALDVRESELGKVNDALQAEKARFESVRSASTNALAAREVAVAAREERAGKREPDLDARETKVLARESAADHRQASLDQKHERLAAALAENLQEHEAAPHETAA